MRPDVVIYTPYVQCRESTHAFTLFSRDLKLIEFRMMM